MAFNSKFTTPQIEQALGAALLQEKSGYNITQDKGQNYASLTEAIAAVSDDKYKVKGLVLTFNTGTEWVSKRYNGEDASGFADEGNWVSVGGGSGEHTLDLSPLFDEEGQPISTVTDEFLAEVKKAYEERYSNAVLFGGNAPMILQFQENLYVIDIMFLMNDNKRVSLAAYHIVINSIDKSSSLLPIQALFDQSGTGTKALTDNGQYAEFAQPTKTENGGTGTITKELKPNTYYEFGECVSLTITLAAKTPNIYNEYMFEFVSGATATQLVLPQEITWIGGEAPVIEANKTYQCSIVNNIAVIGGK